MSDDEERDYGEEQHDNAIELLCEVKGLRDEITELTRQRDALLAVCRKIVDRFDRVTGNFGGDIAIAITLLNNRQLLRDAIALCPAPATAPVNPP